MNTYFTSRTSDTTGTKRTNWISLLVRLVRFAPLVTIVAFSSPLHAQSGFQVIVHRSNALDQIASDDLARIFMRQQTTWRNGSAIAPVDLPESSSTRERFSQQVLGKTATQVKAHWQRELFTGKAVPPAEQKSERDVLAFVAATPGAIGYVSTTAMLPDGVRALSVGEQRSAAASEIFQESDVQRRPELVSRPAVRYPPRLLRLGTEGSVTLQFVIDQNGRVDGTSISVLDSSQPDFEAPAMEAIRRSAFRPAQAGGRAVPVRVRQTIRFAVAKGG